VVVSPYFEDIAGVLAKKITRGGDALACRAVVERFSRELMCPFVTMYMGALALRVVDQAGRPPTLGGLRLEHHGEFEVVRSSPVADEDPAIGDTNLECALLAQAIAV